MKGKKWVLVKHFDGAPKDSDFELVEFDLPEELQENGMNSLQDYALLVRSKLIMCFCLNRGSFGSSLFDC